MFEFVRFSFNTFSIRKSLLSFFTAGKIRDFLLFSQPPKIHLLVLSSVFLCQIVFYAKTKLENS